MTIQLSKSELLHTIKFGVGKKLLETRKVSIFDRKFELLLESVEPSGRTELINEFFGRKVDYSDPDKMISDWQSSKAGQKFIQIFNQISPDSDFNSTNLFDDKAAWNALRLANDVSDGKYDVQDAKDFQEIFLKRQGGSNTNADAKPGETKTDRNGRRMRSRDLPNEPEAPPKLNALPAEIAAFLRQVHFKDYFNELVERMLNQYTKSLSQEKKMSFQDVIEEHFDGIFGNFLTLNEEFSVEEIRDVIREALNDARTQKIPLKGTPNQIYRPMTIGQRPVDPSGYTRSGTHELGGKYDNISVDDEKAINQQKTPDWMRGEDLPDAEEYTDDSLPDAEEVGRDTEEVELTGTEDLPTAEEVPGDNIPTDFADAVDNFLIVPIVEIISEADTKPGVAKTNPKNMVLQAVLPGAVIVGSKFAPQLVVNHQSVVSRILKDKLLFLARTGELYRALPQDIVKSVNAGQDTKTIRLERLPLGEKDENQLGLYFRELTSRGNPKQKQLLRDFTTKYQNTIQRNHELRGTKADAVAPVQTVIGGNDTKIDHTVNGISPTADTGEAQPYVGGPKTQPDSQNAGKAGWSGVPNNSIAGEPPTTPNLNPQDDEASQIGKTQVLTPAEQKLPIQIIGEMTKTIFEFLKKNLEHIESPKRKAAVVAWMQDAFERAIQEIPKTKQAVVTANAPAAQSNPAAKPVAPANATQAKPNTTVAPAPITSTTPVDPATNAPVATTAAPQSAAIPDPTQAAPVVSTASPMAAAASGKKWQGAKNVAGAAPAQSPNAAPPVAVPIVSNIAPIAAPAEQPVEQKPQEGPQDPPGGQLPDAPAGGPAEQVLSTILKYALGLGDPSAAESIYKQAIAMLSTTSSKIELTPTDLIEGRMLAQHVLRDVMSTKYKQLAEPRRKLAPIADAIVANKHSLQESSKPKEVAVPTPAVLAIGRQLLKVAYKRLTALDEKLPEAYRGFWAASHNLVDTILDSRALHYDRYPHKIADERQQNVAKAALGLNEPETQAVPPVAEQQPEIAPAPIATAQPVASKIRTPKAAKVSQAAPIRVPSKGKPNIASWADVDQNKPEQVKGWTGQINNLPAGSDPLPIAPIPNEPAAPENTASGEEQGGSSLDEMDAFVTQELERLKAERAAQVAGNNIKNAPASTSQKGQVTNKSIAKAPAVAPKAQIKAANPVAPTTQANVSTGLSKDKEEAVVSKLLGNNNKMAESINNDVLKGTGYVAAEGSRLKAGFESTETANSLIFLIKPNGEAFFSAKRGSILPELMQKGWILTPRELDDTYGHQVHKTVSFGTVKIKDGAVVPGTIQPAIVSTRPL